MRQINYESLVNATTCSVRCGFVVALTILLFVVLVDSRQSAEASTLIPSSGEQDEFEGYSISKEHVGDNENMQYFVFSKENAVAPDDGWNVLLILPGGDGGAGFENFCRRIHMHAAPEGYLAVQLVAPVWSDDENRVVWPTNKLNPDEAEFTTEEYLSAVVSELADAKPINQEHVFALGWSSSGPPVYSSALQPEPSVTGAFVAMSVYKPNHLPDLENANGRAFYLLHSPQDWIKIDDHARVAETELKEANATVKLQTYRGGHGWREDPYGHIRRGVEWLEKQADTRREE